MDQFIYHNTNAKGYRHKLPPLHSLNPVTIILSFFIEIPVLRLKLNQTFVLFFKKKKKKIKYKRSENLMKDCLLINNENEKAAPVVSHATSPNG